MNTEQIVHSWFTLWEEGNYQNLPLSMDFKHTSPYGKIEGRTAYMNLVAMNAGKFLGHSFEIHDELFEGNRACVRYTTRRGGFTLSVAEWFFVENSEIKEIISYYNIAGEISEKSKLEDPDNILS